MTEEEFAALKPGDKILLDGWERPYTITGPKFGSRDDYKVEWKVTDSDGLDTVAWHYPSWTKAEVAEAQQQTKGAPHYQGQHEPFDVLLEWQQTWPPAIRFFLGNVLKYAARLGRKDGAKVEDDLTKLAHYAEKALEVYKAAVVTEVGSAEDAF